MDNIINAYSRMKLRKNETVTVRYYDINGYHEVTGRFANIFRFENIAIDSIRNKFYFFNEDTMIKSITITNTSSILYYNPYVCENLFKNGKLREQKIDIIKGNVLNRISNEDIKSQEKAINSYHSYEHILTINDIFLTRKQKMLFYKFFYPLITSLRKDAYNKGLDDQLKHIGSGTTSIVFAIGDKIIKIGKPRRCTYLYYNEYLLQPIINKVFYFDDLPVHLEVTQKVQICDVKDNVLLRYKYESMLHELCCNLYHMGLKFNDDFLPNVGILLEDNVIHHDSIKSKVGTFETTSILYNNDLMVLKKGDMVITDLDSITLEDPDKYYNHLSEIGYQKINYKSM